MRYLAAMAAALLLGACGQEEPPAEQSEPAPAVAEPAAEHELDPATGLKMAGDWEIVRATTRVTSTFAVEVQSQ